MAKTINFVFEGKDYTLEFTRETVKSFERIYDINELPKKPVTMLPELFACAFKAHHPSVRREVIDEIYENLGNRMELVQRLGEMYNDTVETLLESGQGNVEWGVNW